MSSFKVAVIGAGPVGCTLARLLHKADIDVTVFESDAAFDARTQGGTLDLHTGSGLAAMKDTGLWQEFQKHARYEGQYLMIADWRGKDYMKIEPEGGKLEERPEIDRLQLRQILLNSLPEGMIKWGHKLVKVDEDGSLNFVDSPSTVSGFDLVVGAEGAWSKVRNLLDPALKPDFSGVGVFSFEIPNAEETAPEVYKFVNRGSVFAHADSMRTCLQQLGDGAISVSVAKVQESDKWADPSWGLEEAKAISLQWLEAWAPVFKEAVAKSETFATRSLYQLAPGTAWAHRKGLTLAGDSAHLMTPFAGEGVNIGLKDALELAKAIIATAKEGGDADALDKRVEAYERDVFARAKEVQTLTDELRKDYFFTKGVPGSIMGRAMARHVKYQTPKLLRPFAEVAVRGYFFVRNFGL